MDLVRIAPATKAVALRGAAVVVEGLSLRKLTQLIAAYPELLGFVAGGKLDVVALLVKGPEMALAIFALGLVGEARPLWWQRLRLPWHRRVLAREADFLRRFDLAAAGDQLDALGAIVDLTFRGERGGPFLTSLASGLAPKPAAPDSPVPSASATSASSTDDSSSG